MAKRKSEAQAPDASTEAAAPARAHKRNNLIPAVVLAVGLGAAGYFFSSSKGGAVGVKGINAVDSASQKTNFIGDIEPPDQGICAGNGNVVETNNIGEVMVDSKPRIGLLCLELISQPPIVD